MNPRRLLKRISHGALQNVGFQDMRRLVEALGFSLSRTSGSHHVFTHPQLPEVVNLQEVAGQAKPYQVRPVLRLIERYNLAVEDDK